MELEGTTVNRGGFIRRLGKFVAIGLGIALIPAKAARAQSTYCCRDPECGADACGPGIHAYKCWDSCPPASTCCVGCQGGWGNCQYGLPCLCV